MREKQGFIYILFNVPNGTLYVGVTSDLVGRMYKHKHKVYPGFTKKYGVDKLGYYEVFGDIYNAINREKQLKAGSRTDKLKLINEFNPNWFDLYDSICQ